MTLEWGILIPSLHSKTKYELLDTFSGKQPTRQTLFVNFTNVFSRGNIHNSQKFLCNLHNLNVVFWLIAALIMMGIWAGMAIMMTGLRTYLSLRTYSALQLHSQAG